MPIKPILRALLVLVALLLNTQLFAQQLGQQSLSQSSYIIDKNGKLFAWGWNHDGQLGIGGTTDQNIPVQVALPSQVGKWVMIAGGARHALGVGDSDKLYAWGYNGDAQLGVGTPGGSYSSPSRITNPAGVTSWRWVSAGVDHSFAIAQNGMLYGWGANNRGQLGLGNQGQILSPKLVPVPSGVTGWSMVAAGDGMTLAISTSGDLYVTGLDTTMGLIPSRQITSFTKIKSDTKYRTTTMLATLGLSRNNYMAILANGSVQDNTTSYIYPTTTASVAVGSEHTLYLDAAGYINLHGSTIYGQSTNPDFPSGVTQWVGITAGMYHTLALGNDGNLYSWGRNLFGELGDGTGINQSQPVLVRSFGDPLRMSASLSGPQKFAGAPFTVDLSVTNTSTSTSLAFGNGYLTLDAPLRYNNSDPTQVLSPPFVSPGTNALASWTLNADSLIGSGIGINPVRYCAYVREQGSSPVLVQGSITIGVKTFDKHEVTIRVIDSASHLPLSSIPVRLNLGSKQDTTFSTDNKGIIILHSVPNMTLTADISVENYLSQHASAILTAQTDSENYVLRLLPAPIIGRFEKVASIGTRFDRIFFPKPEFGFAISGNDLLSTSDSGVTWKQVFKSLLPLHDLFFLNEKLGWIAGDSGTLFKTVSGGAFWEQQLLPTTARLNALGFINDTMGWVAGEDGAFYGLHGATWLPDGPSTHADWQAMSVLSPIFGIVTGKQGTTLRNPPNWYLEIPDTSLSINDITIVQNSFANTIEWATSNFDLLEIVPSGILSTKLDVPLTGVWPIFGNILFVTSSANRNFVTYDAGATASQIHDDSAASSIIFFNGKDGYLGHSDGTFEHYVIRSSPLSSVVFGRVRYAKNDMPAIGVEVTLFAPGKPGYGSFTNKVGVFTIPAVDSGQYQMTFIRPDGSWHTVSITVTLGAVLEQDFIIGASNSVHTSGAPSPSLQISPNPSSSSVTVRYGLDHVGEVKISLMDVLGREVMTRSIAANNVGDHEETIATQSLAPGTYFVRIQTPSGEAVRPLTIAR